MKRTILLLLACSCVPSARQPSGDADSAFPTVVVVPRDDDPPYVDAAAPACLLACARLRELGCPEAERPDGGESCYQTCARLELGGHFSLRPACVSDAGTVDRVRTCGTVRCLRTP